jgi:hypothetical protein
MQQAIIMGWYHTADFDGFENGGEAALACAILRSAGTKEETLPAAASTTSTTTTTPSGETACPSPAASPPPPNFEFIYHLCQKSKWKEAKKLRLSYFPPTFVNDGKFMRASAYKKDLVSTANLYYEDTPGEWIILEIHCQTLYSLGIPIVAEDAPESTHKETVKCLQIFGGILTTLPGLITKEYGMKRDSMGEFWYILEPVKKKDVVSKVEEKREEAPRSAKPTSEKPKEKSRRFWPKFKK